LIAAAELEQMTVMTMFSRMVFAGGLLAAALLINGCGTTGNDGPSGNASWPTKDNPGPEPVAHLVVGDTVTVTLSGGPTGDDQPPHVEPIKEDGTISMPDIGQVQAAGKTPGELQNGIHDMYVPKYYTHVTVAVSASNRIYYVGGEVKQPDREEYYGETTVMQAIASAGDFTDFANRHNIWLIRGGRHLKVDADDIFKNPGKDPLVYPGDRIEGKRRLF
jgi:protein involved in polysaccharide export with SLBB domain